MRFLIGDRVLGKTFLPVIVCFLIILTPVIHTSPFMGEITGPPVVLTRNHAGGREHLARAVLRPEPGHAAVSHAFGNPAGCSSTPPSNILPEERLAEVQDELGDTLSLEKTRQHYIWNGSLQTMMHVTADSFAFEFTIDQFKPPHTYKADKIATIFMTHGFVVWFRTHGESFRLLAVPMMEGVHDSAWGDYVRAYWQPGGVPNDDTIVPVMKKLPCHWMVDQGYVTDRDLGEMFHLDWHLPDYLAAGRKYLASTCKEANRISQEKIGYWDARSMCGPLTWRIVKDANSFPYRIGNWETSTVLFTMVNPRWNGRPWIGFDPETYDLIRIKEPMAGYDFSSKGDLYAGDILYSYSTLFSQNDGRFDHIFLVAGVGADQSRISITNLVSSSSQAECSIREVTLYTPGNLAGGVINYEWNNHGYGSTGSTGFDIFRWKWITYHMEAKPVPYTVRWGDTIETIAFDWKTSPQGILNENGLQADVQLLPGRLLLCLPPDITCQVVFLSIAGLVPASGSAPIFFEVSRKT